MNASNINKYNEVIAKRKNGTPMLFVLPWLTNSGERYRKKTKQSGHGSPVLDFLEDWLIGLALQKNSKLINNRQTKFLRRLHVIGVFNSRHGESNSDSRAFMQMIR